MRSKVYMAIFFMIAVYWFFQLQPYGYAVQTLLLLLCGCVYMIVHLTKEVEALRERLLKLMSGE